MLFCSWVTVTIYKKIINLNSNFEFLRKFFILVLGMGISTVTAGRIRKGQLKNKNGEEEITYMESLPHVALSKVEIKLQFKNSFIKF